MPTPRRHLQLLVLALLAFALSASAALAAPGDISRKRAEAQAARERVQELGEQLEPAIERWNQAQSELAQVRDEIELNQRRISLVQGNLGASRAILANKLIQDYKYGEGDPLAAILSSGSLASMLDAADLLERSQLQVADLLARLQSDQRELATRQAALDKARARATELEATAQAEKESIDAALAEQERLVSGLEDAIAQLEAEERERQRRIAEEARRRLEQLRQIAEQAAAANPAPDIGGAAPAVNVAVSGSSSGGSSSGGSESIPAPPPTDGSVGARAVAVAMQFLGVPYVWGGASPGGFDCSGLVMYAYGQLGVSLPHFTGALWNSGHRVSQGELIPGDLVFFYPDVHHVGIYIGGGQFIHAPSTGDVVKISSLSERAGVYSGAVRPY